MRDLLDLTVMNELHPNVKERLTKIVQLLQVYARLTELELAAGEEGPKFGPLPVALPENIQQLITEWALREEAKTEEQVQDSEADGDEAELSEMEALAEEAISMMGAKSKDAAALRHVANM